MSRVLTVLVNFLVLFGSLNPSLCSGTLPLSYHQFHRFPFPLHLVRLNGPCLPLSSCSPHVLRSLSFIHNMGRVKVLPCRLLRCLFRYLLVSNLSTSGYSTLPFCKPWQETVMISLSDSGMNSFHQLLSVPNCSSFSFYTRVFFVTDQTLVFTFTHLS